MVEREDNSESLEEAFLPFFLPPPVLIPGPSSGRFLLGGGAIGAVGAEGPADTPSMPSVAPLLVSSPGPAGWYTQFGSSVEFAVVDGLLYLLQYWELCPCCPHVLHFLGAIFLGSLGQYLL